MKKLLISLPGQDYFHSYKEDPNSAQTFHFCSFDGAQKISMKVSRAEVEDDQLMEGLAKPEVNALDKDAYLQLIAQTVADIRKGVADKVVISRQEFFDLSIDPLQLYQQLVSKYPRACTYLFVHPVAGIWMGATPELLLQSDGNTVKTMSLAGTRRLGEEASFDQKEVVEQQMVTDYIRSCFEDNPGLSNVSVKGPELHQAGQLVHYKTEISGELSNQFEGLTFVNQLHPTPAVGGTPVKESLEYLQAHEGYDREFYAGYFGLESNDQLDFFVNLRCMQVVKDGLILYAGGGITKDSDPLAEWEETQTKMQTLLSVLQS